MSGPLQWYYENESGLREGPVQEEEFLQLRNSGIILPHSKVWHSEMGDWQALHLIDPTAGAQDPVSGETIENCGECGNAFPKIDLLKYGEVPVCVGCKKAVIQKLEAGKRIGKGIWQDGTVLIAEFDQVLPKRCLKCNAPGAQIYGKRLVWMPRPISILLLLIIGGTLLAQLPWISLGAVALYFIVSFFIQKKGRLSFYLCKMHQKKRRLCYIYLSAALAITPIAFVSGSSYIKYEETHTLGIILMAIGGIALLAVLFLNLKARNIILPKNTKNGLLFVHGAGADFLTSLPKWYGLKND